MKNLTPRILQAALAAALALPALFPARAADNPSSAADKKMSELFPDTVVARGKGFEVKRSQVEEELLAYKASLAARGQQFPEAQRSMFESNMVDKLVIQDILIARETPADRAAGQEKADNFVALNRTNAASEEFFAQQVKAATGGLTVDQYRVRMAQQASQEQVVDRELRSTLKISDADVRKFYDQNTNASEQPEMVRASHILISTKDPLNPNQPLSPEKKKEKEDLAKKIRARAAAGEDFAKLAHEFSDDPRSKNNGGEYTFPRGKMVREFEAAAFSMRTNQVSDLVETQFGYHIIKLSEKIPAKKIEFEKLSARIKEYLIDQQLRTVALQPYLEKIKKEAGVEFFGMNSSVKPSPASVPAPAAGK
jgi:peptidyl-prolyl cis-trans isomerase C